MLPKCNKCNKCHTDMDIEKALGVFQMCLILELDQFNSEHQSDICMLHRKVKAYDILVETLKQNGLCK